MEPIDKLGIDKELYRKIAKEINKEMAIKLIDDILYPKLYVKIDHVCDIRYQLHRSLKLKLE